MKRLFVINEEEFNFLEGRKVYNKDGKEIVIDDVYCDGDLDCLIVQDVNGDHYFVGDLYWQI